LTDPAMPDTADEAKLERAVTRAKRDHRNRATGKSELKLRESEEALRKCRERSLQLPGEMQADVARIKQMREEKKMRESAEPVASTASAPQEMSKQDSRMQRLREVFNAFDGDNSGALEREEMHIIGLGMHPDGNWSSRKTDKLIRKMDTDGDGAVSFEEFFDFYRPIVIDGDDETFERGMGQLAAVAAALRAPKPQPTLKKSLSWRESQEPEPAPLPEEPVFETRMARLHRFFNGFDTDVSGAWDRSELNLIAYGMHQGKWTEKQTDALMRRMDTDGDGRVSFEEFLEFYRPALLDATDEQFERGMKAFQAVADFCRDDTCV